MAFYALLKCTTPAENFPAAFDSNNILGRLRVLLVAAVAMVLASTTQAATSGLQVTFGPSGLETLTYNGVALENVTQNSSDAFHIWHMKSTDLNGNVLSAGQYGWGEDHNSRSWNLVTLTWTYSFVWGTIQVQYLPSATSLGIKVTETNNTNSGIIFDGATIYPLALHFPALPAGFISASYQQLATNTTGPSATLADYGTGEVVAAYDNALQPLYTGYEPGGNNTYTALLSSTSPDDLATFAPHLDRSIKPGQTDTFTMSLRFGASGTPIASLASDVFTTWAQAWPAKLSWPDRRIIGSVYLASSPQGNPSQPGGYPNNPRRYFNDSNAQDFDVRTTAGLARFQAKILQQAESNVKNLQQLNAQGAITWDIEGEQYPQTTSYVCEPDEIAQAAPEMESVINDSSSPYNGKKLDDAYFSIMHNAGFRIGVCVRPQHFAIQSNGTAGQTYLTDSQAVAELIRKMKYAHDRWGATLFYLDSTVESNGGTLPVWIFQQAAAALPDSLLIPEETTPAYYAYTAAFQSFLFHTDLGTPAAVYDYYPKAFSVNLVNDVDAAKLEEYKAQLTASVKRGDVLVVHADYWQQNNPTVMQIYQEAGSSGIAGVRETAQETAKTSAAKTVVACEGGDSPSEAEVLYPQAGQKVAGYLTVAICAAGKADLLIDGAATFNTDAATYRVDTRQLADGPHTLQAASFNALGVEKLSDAVNIIVENTIVEGKVR